MRYAHPVLPWAFSQAVKWRLLASNLAKAVDLPKIVRTEMHAMPPRKRPTSWTPLRWIAGAFALATSMRPGEALALRWRDVDFDAGMVVVRRAPVTFKGKHVFAEPKTARSRRTIPLPPSLVQDLRL